MYSQDQLHRAQLAYDFREEHREGEGKCEHGGYVEDCEICKEKENNKEKEENE